MELMINSCATHDCQANWSWDTSQKGFSDYDLFMVFRGHGQLLAINSCTKVNRTFEVLEGQCILLAPNTHYQGTHDPLHPLWVISVHFDFVEGGKKVYPVREPIAKTIIATAFYKELLLRIVQHFNSAKADLASAFLAAALGEFFASNDSEPQKSSPLFDALIREICEKIDSSKKKPTLSELAKRYHYSERYLGKKFTQITGKTFSEYTTNSRISKVKTLLFQTDFPLSAIAEETDFYDVCHLTRTFTRTVGVSPAKFRKMHSRVFLDPSDTHREE